MCIRDRDNIDNAIKFAKENNHKFKVVTLDGDILNPGGSLTGGSLRVRAVSYYTSRCV